MKVLAALHLARSFRFRDIYESTVVARFAGPLAGMSAERLTAAFVEQYRRSPEPGELEALVTNHVQEWYRSNVFFVNELGEAHNKILAMFEDKYVQIARIPVRGVELVTGDTPLVIANSGWRRVGVAIGDASLIYMPLSPRVGVCLTTRREEAILGDIPLFEAQRLNNLIWRSAKRFIVAHPANDLSRSLAIGLPKRNLV